MKLVLGACALFVCFSVPASADLRTLGSDRDNTLYEDASGSISNGSGEFFFSGLNSQMDIRRGLLRFDIAASVPAGATIDSVRLILDMSRTNAGPASFSLHRVLADWGEAGSDAPGSEGGGAPSENGDATWIHTFFPATNWAAVGGDFDPNASASTIVDQIQRYVWDSTPALVADVQAWLDDPDQNFGWLLKDDTESAPNSSKRFGTHENTDPDQRPILEVGFIPASGCPKTSFCLAEPNSTGIPAFMFAAGDCSIAAANLRLLAHPVPSQPTIFFSGNRRAQRPFGDGWMCADGGIRRLSAPLLPGGETVALDLDLARLGFTPGPTIFQAWYRDPTGAGSGFNTSDAIEVVLLP